MGKDKVCRRVLGAHSRSLSEIVTRHLRWFGHVLRIRVHHLSSNALFACAGQSCRKPLDHQVITWSRGIKLALVLASVLASHFRGWGPRDEHCCWLETLERHG